MLTRRRPRGGWTLVELAISFAIILVIIGLLLPIFLTTWQVAQETKASVEVKKLDAACETFKSTFGRYPPGRILLCESMEGYRQAIVEYLCQTHFQKSKQDKDGLAWLAMDSMEYLKSIFPNIDLNAGHDWNGDGVIDNRQYYLQGDECLIYFLGGMRHGTGALDAQGSNRTPATGFNTDKTSPTKQSSGTRLGPFFQFDEGRITYFTRTNRVVPPGPYEYDPDETTSEKNWCVGSSTGLHPRPEEQSILFFPHYRDLWGKPYYYFAARAGIVDNYSHMYSPFCYRLGFLTSNFYHYHCFLADISVSFPGGSPNDPEEPDPPKPGVWPGFIPYMQSYQEQLGTSYFNPKRFQIISAGADRQFGSGGMYNPANPEKSTFVNFKPITEQPKPTPDELRANYDNITNINFGRLVPRP